MKRKVSIILTAVMVISTLLVGCGNKPAVEEIIESNMEVISSDLSIEETSVIDKDDVETTEDATVTETAKPDATATTKPSTSKATAKPASKATPAPTAKPTTKPSSGSSGNSGSSGSGSNTQTPVATAKPTAKPTAAPTAKPSSGSGSVSQPTPAPTAKPTAAPTQAPKCTHDYEFVRYGYDGAPTCTSYGSGIYKCKLCSYESTQVLSPTGNHNWTLTFDGSSYATCAYGGEMQYTCSTCGAFKIEEVKNPNNHTGGIDANGNCGGCGAHLVDVPAAPTVPDTNTNTSESTTPDTGASDTGSGDTTPDTSTGDTGSGDTTVTE